VLIVYADAPLIRGETLKLFLDYHLFKKATVSLISFTSPYPNPYGRIIRNRVSGDVEQIVEAKDCNIEELLIDEVNSGIFAVDSSFLKPAIDSLKNDNAQKEYYLTDIVGKATKEGQRVTGFKLHDSNEALGVNTPSELETVNRILAQRRISNLIDDGVLFDDPGSCFIDAGTALAPSASIGPNVQLRGQCKIEAGVIIEGTAIVINSYIKKGAHIRLGCRIEDSIIGENTVVGPFAHLRPGTVLGNEVKVGNFVETKNAKLADGAKASHLTYLGDCTVGENTNIGAGTITCNYDGYKKSTTTIGKDVFIGSNSALVAPVTLNDGVTIGAGSVITKDIPEYALALTRPELTVREGWSKKKRQTSQKKK